MNWWKPFKQKKLNELSNQVQCLQGQIQALRNENASQMAEMKQAQTNLLASEMKLRQSISRCAPSMFSEDSPAEYLESRLSLEDQFKQLEQEVPHAYSIWRPLLDVNAEAYEGFPTDSCSVEGHRVSTLFRGFLASYICGRVLDIGCGPQPIPNYLKDVPVETLYGVDPLSCSQDHPFSFYRGLAEYLPWQDNQFDVVVVGTSLDHVLIPTKVFEEVRRVLRPGGVFVAWIGCVAGAKPYDPYAEDVERVDAFHLFHYDRETFLAAVAPCFSVVEEVSFDALGSEFFGMAPNE